MKIILLCGAGMSTSLLAKKMQQHADQTNQDMNIKAIAFNDVDSGVEEADLYLLGPQIEYYHEKMQDLVPEKPVLVIDMGIYALMNGQKALDWALKEMKKWKK